MNRSPKGREERKITFDGKTKTIQQWAEIFGVTPSTIHMRMKIHGTPESTLKFRRKYGKPNYA